MMYMVKLALFIALIFLPSVRLSKSQEAEPIASIEQEQHRRIKSDLFETLQLSEDQDKTQKNLFLQTLTNAYLKTLPLIHPPKYNKAPSVLSLDALMIDNPTDDFLSLINGEEKICKVIVREMEQSISPYEEKSEDLNKQAEKSVYVHREDLFHPIHHTVQREHFIRAVPFLRALLILLPLYKQIHPISDMIIRSFARPDIESLRISGENTPHSKHMDLFLSRVLEIKKQLEASNIYANNEFISKQFIQAALYSLFVLHITGERKAYEGVKELCIEGTYFHRVVIDLSVFSSNLEKIIFEENYNLHTVLIIKPSSLITETIPEIETDETNANCQFIMINEEEFNKINE
ncbi:hypothetical protein NEFER03_1881 [Nematocida sp. LUAm3]|nr:hypothetical protein NEFER03_1881 [Nematocida sp. LUAm3]KAI5173968.1 hypothetical protein NEFER02_0435 [Nematocida sp. LUAm2]KAI5177287.1 hypothetical protein NEFER01_0562 [Nematocida sp. LUAm1]